MALIFGHFRKEVSRLKRIHFHTFLRIWTCVRLFTRRAVRALNHCATGARRLSWWYMKKTFNIITTIIIVEIINLHQLKFLRLSYYDTKCHQFWSSLVLPFILIRCLTTCWVWVRIMESLTILSITDRTLPFPYLDKSSHIKTLIGKTSDPLIQPLVKLG